MVRKVLNRKVRPILRYKWLKLESVVQSRDDSSEICEEVVEVCGMEVMFTMIRSISRPRIDGRIVGLRSVGDPIFIVRLGVCVECLLENFRCGDCAQVFS